MKPNTINERLYDELNLLYDKIYISAQLTDDPSAGQLDIDAFFEGKERCWQDLRSIKIKDKKSLILSSWYFQYLDENAQKAWRTFFGDLIDEGFTIYIPEESRLIKLSDKTLLLTQLTHFSPITKQAALKLAAKERLSEEQTDIINLQRLDNLARLLETKYAKRYDFQIKNFINIGSNFPILPANLTLEELQQIDELIEPHDKLHYTFTDRTNNILPVRLQRHVYSLSLESSAGLNLATIKQTLFGGLQAKRDLKVI